MKVASFSASGSYATVAVATGDETTRREELRAQGGIVLMCDGVQFDDRAPVLYLAGDAVSGTPLFGQRKALRSEADLRKSRVVSHANVTRPAPDTWPIPGATTHDR